jgi:hypothetical protein
LCSPRSRSKYMTTARQQSRVKKGESAEIHFGEFEVPDGHAIPVWNTAIHNRRRRRS